MTSALAALVAVIFPGQIPETARHNRHTSYYRHLAHSPMTKKRSRELYTKQKQGPRKTVYQYDPIKNIGDCAGIGGEDLYLRARAVLGRTARTRVAGTATTVAIGLNFKKKVAGNPSCPTETDGQF